MLCVSWLGLYSCDMLRKSEKLGLCFDYVYIYIYTQRSTSSLWKIGMQENHISKPNRVHTYYVYVYITDIYHIYIYMNINICKDPMISSWYCHDIPPFSHLRDWSELPPPCRCHRWQLFGTVDKAVGSETQMPHREHGSCVHIPWLTDNKKSKVNQTTISTIKNKRSGWFMLALCGNECSRWLLIGER